MAAFTSTDFTYFVANFSFGLSREARSAVMIEYFTPQMNHVNYVISHPYYLSGQVVSNKCIGDDAKSLWSPPAAATWQMV